MSWSITTREGKKSCLWFSTSLFSITIIHQYTLEVIVILTPWIREATQDKVPKKYSRNWNTLIEFWQWGMLPLHGLLTAVLSAFMYEIQAVFLVSVCLMNECTPFEVIQKFISDTVCFLWFFFEQFWNPPCTNIVKNLYMYYSIKNSSWNLW